MKLSKLFLFKDFYKVLINEFGKDEAIVIWNEMQVELDKLEKEYPELDKKESILPAAAIYRIIEKIKPGKGLETIRDYGTQLGRKMEGILKTITALPGVPNFIWKHMDKIANKMSSGYECREVIVKEHECSLDVVGCLLYDSAKKVDVPEVAQLFCCMDKVYMNGMRGVRYQRTKSIAEGDDCCDYRLEDSRNQ